MIDLNLIKKIIAEQKSMKILYNIVNRIFNQEIDDRDLFSWSKAISFWK